jgi:hypothetical protein
VDWKARRRRGMKTSKDFTEGNDDTIKEERQMEKYSDIEGRMSRMGEAEGWGSSEWRKEIRSGHVGSVTNPRQQGSPEGASVTTCFPGPIRLEKRVTMKSYRAAKKYLTPSRFWSIGKQSKQSGFIQYSTLLLIR